MNYRHAFHAGNFADLVKHAALTLILDRLTGEPEPLLVLDSHAGAGAYDLDGEMARKSGEAENGVRLLMADDSAPEALRPLKTAVRSANGAGPLKVYPGSPALIVERLRRDDEYVGAELRSDDFSQLSRVLARSRRRARAVRVDGFDLVKRQAADRRRLLVVIDPPFERPEDYDEIVQALKPVLQRPRPATTLIWLPLKDLETFDAFLRGVEALDPPAALVVEARLRPLTDPMRLNGCALLILAPPVGLEAPLRTATEWVIGRAGDPGGIAKIWTLGG